MKTHPAFKAVLAAAKRDAKIHDLTAADPRRRSKKLKEAIAVVSWFVEDNHDFIEFYNDDADLR